MNEPKKGRSNNARMLVAKIKPQFPVDTPEGKLMFAIIERAILDANGKHEHREEAKRYLRGPIPYAVACGVDPEWIRFMAKKIHFSIAAAE